MGRIRLLSGERGAFVKEDDNDEEERTIKRSQYIEYNTTTKLYSDKIIGDNP